jgi:gamma-butyrobetaine dioxygenase
VGQGRKHPADPSPVEGDVELFPSHLTVVLDGAMRRFHYVWLRDNSWASEDRVAQSSERRLFTADIHEAVEPVSVGYDPDRGLDVRWDDGRACIYAPAWLRRHDYSDEPTRRARRFAPTLWSATASGPPRLGHAEVVGTTTAQLAYLDAIREFGAVIVTGVPSRDGEVERFAELFGPVRELAFARVHDVRLDPAGYNVAHTSGELKPHTDFPSYAWPPSIQLLHFRVNRTTGGESNLVDGWAAIAELRRTHPEHFAVLTRVPVPYQLFSDHEDTAAEAPMIELDPSGDVRLCRFSNQLAQPLRVSFDQVEAFYAAYRTFGRIIDSGRYRSTFTCADGELLTVHGHRVLHGRLAYDPDSGARHLQNVYMDFDDLTARRRVLRGEHKPIPAQ